LPWPCHRLQPHLDLQAARFLEPPQHLLEDVLLELPAELEPLLAVGVLERAVGDAVFRDEELPGDDVLVCVLSRDQPLLLKVVRGGGAAQPLLSAVAASLHDLYVEPGQGDERADDEAGDAEPREPARTYARRSVGNWRPTDWELDDLAAGP